MLCSGVSQRRIAKLLCVTRKTVARKFLFASQYYKEPPVLDKTTSIQFDHMETWIHTKLKPAAILVVVDKESRQILDLKASQMPAKGLIAKKSRKKYGRLPDERMPVMLNCFKEMKGSLNNLDLIESDQHPLYKKAIRLSLFSCVHRTYKGRRGCVVGQGELKAGGRDPLFSLNHTCAMIRANINRLFRRTWCTSKTIENLQFHLDIYKNYHNTKLI